MNLEDLAGKHTLFGVDFWNEEVDKYGYPENAQHVLFELDSGTYVAVENPDDGYRSMMEEVKKVDLAAKNRFEGEEVIGKYCKDSSKDILELVSSKTGLVVLRVGTDNLDDYYPWFVHEWMPENLSHNQNAT